MRGRLLSGIVTGVLLTVTAAACGSPAERTAQEVPGVCSGVPDCRVVARTDVDGDGSPDQVGFVSAASSPSPPSVSRSTVVVRVSTAAGDLLRHPLKVLWFPRGEFYGAAPLDGVGGAELVVGSTMGAHTMWFTSLTVRSGRLVVLPAPGADQEWMIDGAFSFSAGVVRRLEDGQAVVVLREAGRRGTRPVFAGRDRTFVWADGGWQHRSTERTRVRGDAPAARIGGWHVDGLPRFPEL